jgi:GNAT superfamily N-acetyltransferase
MAADIAVRDFTESDYPLLVALDAAVHNDDPRPIAQWQHEDATRNPEVFFRRHVISTDGVAVACGHFGHVDWIEHPDRYWFQILVPPSRPAGDAIRQLYLDHALETLLPRHPQALLSGMVESNRDHIRFLTDHGFSEVHREHHLQLELDGFDPARYTAARQRAAGQGIRLVPLTDLAGGGADWRERLHPVYQQLVQDQPAPDPPHRDTLEEWVRAVLEGPDFDAGLWIIATDEDRIVGLSQAMVNLERPTVAYSGLTGVLAGYRRRGIATALKVELLARVKSRGVARIKTSNEENNPMYRINLGLGFVPRPDWVMYERRL